MATRKPTTEQAAEQAAEPATDPQDMPPDGCVFMWRANPEDGSAQRAAVNVASGSVEVMAAGGWSTEAPAR